MTLEDLLGAWRWSPERAIHTAADSRIVGRCGIISSEGALLRVKHCTDYSDGQQQSWTWEGGFDGVLRPLRLEDDGTLIADAAFYWVQDRLLGSTYFKPDGTTGSVYIQLEPGLARVSGCFTHPDGSQWAFHDTWTQTP